MQFVLALISLCRCTSRIQGTSLFVLHHIQVSQVCKSHFVFQLGRSKRSGHLGEGESGPS